MGKDGIHHMARGRAAPHEPERQAVRARRPLSAHITEPTGAHPWGSPVGPRVSATGDPGSVLEKPLVSLPLLRAARERVHLTCRSVPVMLETMMLKPFRARLRAPGVPAPRRRFRGTKNQIAFNLSHSRGPDRAVLLKTAICGARLWTPVGIQRCSRGSPAAMPPLTSGASSSRRCRISVSHCVAADCWGWPNGGGKGEWARVPPGCPSARCRRRRLRVVPRRRIAWEARQPFDVVQRSPRSPLFDLWKDRSQGCAVDRRRARAATPFGARSGETNDVSSADS